MPVAIPGLNHSDDELEDDKEAEEIILSGNCGGRRQHLRFLFGVEKLFKAAR